MEFSKAYSRREFVSFLRDNFLPEDFTKAEEEIIFPTKTTYSRRAYRLGSSEKLNLTVFEILHSSTHDARIGLSREAFRLLMSEGTERALVLFVPEGDPSTYRFSFIEMTLHWEEGESKVAKSFSNPRRYSYRLGEGIACYTPNKYLIEKGRVTDDKDLHERFSVEVLTDDFYRELSVWYAWAIRVIRFPNDIHDRQYDEKFNNEGAIRLITRLIFVWFLKQRDLIPNEFFDEAYIRDQLLLGFDPNASCSTDGNSTKSCYYKAILQNLFFAMLNCPLTDENNRQLKGRRFRNGRGDFDNNKLMRYEDHFSNPRLFTDLANSKVPFLNGGLFDCLDEKDKGLYYDGFTDNKKVSQLLIVPDFLFFGENVDKDIDLSGWFGDNRMNRVDARGLILILKSYNFTVEENTPSDKEVSLDPELLGKAFEQLLAAYNPETKDTARKHTGSYYTPREIVQYMVDESLVAHLKRTVGDGLEAEYRKMLSYSDEPLNLTDCQRKAVMKSIYECKILDPACGSGAFPMGILQQMVHVMNKIDPDNDVWREMMMRKALDETSEAYLSATDEERREAVADIERSFNVSVNRPDYARKLYLIENCIYGVDIQPIAIQISKLRFFISLVIDQNTNDDPADNFGIRPLPNLEAKFVAANTLIGLTKQDGQLGRTAEIIEIEKQLKIANHKIFGARSRQTKKKWRDRVVEHRQELASQLNYNGFLTEDEANQLAEWDMFDQNASSTFFDPDLMFGVKGGFDIVIGNPPFINIVLIPVSDKDTYRRLYTCFEGRADIFSVFIEKALRTLSCVQGVISFIVPSVVHSNVSYKKLRSLFLDNHWLGEVCYVGGNVFDATVDTTILRFEKRGGDSIRLINATDLSDRKSATVSRDYFKSQGNIISLSALSTMPIFDKLYSSSLLLLSDHFTVFQGIVTGCNPAFVFDSEDEALSHGIDIELLHPLCHGRDIGKYKIKNRERRILYIDKNVNLDDFPNTKSWLLNFKDALDKRREVRKRTIKWYSLQWPRVKSELDTREKIFVQRTRNENLKTRIVAALDDQACYTSEGIFIIIPIRTTVPIKYLLAVLNSKIINFLFAKKFLNLGIKLDYLKGVRIPRATAEKQSVIIALVDRIMSAKRECPSADTASLEQEIDRLVYKLYGLTYDEVRTVDPQTGITREEYEKTF